MKGAVNTTACIHTIWVIRTYHGYVEPPGGL